MGIKNIQNILSEIWKICSCTSSVLYTLCSIHCVKEYLFIPQILESTYRWAKSNTLHFTINGKHLFQFLKKKNLKVNISCGCQSHSPYFSLANVKYPWLTEFTNFDNSSQQFFPTFYLCLQQVTYSVWELILPWSRKWFSWKPNISLLCVNKPYSINLISFTLLVPKHKVLNKLSSRRPITWSNWPTILDLLPHGYM